MILISHKLNLLQVCLKNLHDLSNIELFSGSPDGSLSCLTPVDEYAFKRLQLLQGQLTRNIQHVAGLNPKAFR